MQLSNIATTILVGHNIILGAEAYVGLRTAAIWALQNDAADPVLNDTHVSRLSHLQLLLNN